MELAVIIGIILIIVVIAYAIFLYWAYLNQRFIFSPYTPNPGPGLFQPGGDVIKLSPEQQQCRAYALGAIIGDDGTPQPPPSSCFNIDPYTSGSSS